MVSISRVGNAVFAAVAVALAFYLQGCALDSLLGSLSGTMCQAAVGKFLADKAHPFADEAKSKCTAAKDAAHEQGIEGSKITELETKCTDSVDSLLDKIKGDEEKNYTDMCIEQLNNRTNASATEITSAISDWMSKMHLGQDFKLDWRTHVRSIIVDLCEEFDVKPPDDDDSGDDDEKAGEDTTAGDETTAGDDDDDDDDTTEDSDAKEDETTAGDDDTTDDPDAKDSRLFAKETRSGINPPQSYTLPIFTFGTLTVLGVVGVLRQRRHLENLEEPMVATDLEVE